mmetsp:Transcript_139384/g.277928  ORF Transcript_139384/g.277928 Transcript_139384/m.277928 type:complete len:222 (+) Transcript_139384:413-1078(+)
MNTPGLPSVPGPSCFPSPVAAFRGPEVEEPHGRQQRPAAYAQGRAVEILRHRERPAASSPDLCLAGTGGHRRWTPVTVHTWCAGFGSPHTRLPLIHARHALHRSQWQTHSVRCVQPPLLAGLQGHDCLLYNDVILWLNQVQQYSSPLAVQRVSREPRQHGHVSLADRETGPRVCQAWLPHPLQAPRHGAPRLPHEHRRSCSQSLVASLRPSTRKKAGRVVR